MTLDEGEVFHIALTYEQEYKKLFASQSEGQSFRRNSLPRRGDPRKSNLFRQCWKLRRETRGLIEQRDYRHYIHANMFIINHYKGHVEPNCMTGDKAWLRYKVWKRRYDIKLAETSAQAPPPSVSTTDPKLIADLDRTKKFLYERCDGKTPTLGDIERFKTSGILKFWIATSKISPYYLLLSPYIQKTCELTELFATCSSSAAVYRSKITTQVKDYFAYEFDYEFNKI